MSDSRTTAKIAQAVEAFNTRRYDDAADLAAAMQSQAVGQDEVFWMGLTETCRGFSLIMGGELRKAQPVLVAAMEKLRNFGYRHQELEVTSVLAGLRRGIEESRMVLDKEKRTFDLSLLPKLKMSARADES